MCGIFGYFQLNDNFLPKEHLQLMANTIKHRGPDATGIHNDKHYGLGNCRLSIIDLSPESNQPLYSNDKDIVVVQNGEIYNYIEIREELKKLGTAFHTTGDTEVILEAYKKWGYNFIKKLNGMFAIAIYDKRKDTLYLYRDRLGVKPLYYTEPSQNQPLWFGSEIKAILATGYKTEADINSIAEYMALNYIPQPSTAFAGIKHLPPGHMAEISFDKKLKITCYWSLTNVIPEKNISTQEAIEQIIYLLDDATRIRMRSDAPFGAFLSGGLDSSSVVAFMSRYQTEGGLNSFSIGFEDPRFDESIYATMAAKRFGLNHSIEIMHHDITYQWPRFIWHCDQPHGDVSFMPTNQVAAFAAKSVKMVLTGDGGDELFAGYEKYLDIFPNGETHHLSDGWEQRFAEMSGLLQNNQHQNLLQGQLRDTFLTTNPYSALSNIIHNTKHQDPINRVLLAETQTLLPGNNLVKPDRMAMANSLEVRSPFLDYRMAELAFQIPGAMKLKHGETKAILKQAMLPILGDQLTYRRKQMFTVPIGEWFKNSLLIYCQNILLDGRLESRNLFSIKMIRQILNEHVDGIANHTRILRAIISLELWYRLFIDKDPNTLSSINHQL